LGVSDPDGLYEGPVDAKKATLERLLGDTKVRTIQFTYDFGEAGVTPSGLIGSARQLRA
jgi:hypothetical protein